MFWDEREDASIACTDNRRIAINAANYLTQSFPTRQLKADSLVGLNGHELGHVLYSDFIAMTHYSNALMGGRLYPALPEDVADDNEDALAEITDALHNDEVARNVIVQIANSFNNILEDVYVEARIMNDFPGRFSQGIRLNNIRFTEYVPTIKIGRASCRERVSSPV